MERAATQCVEWIEQQQWQQKRFSIFCGRGNNGGDGLAIARMLLQRNYSVAVYVADSTKHGSEDFEQNLQRLRDLSLEELHFINSTDNLPKLQKDGIIIDALFGSGLNKPLLDTAAELVHFINSLNATVVSIDLPSGLFIDKTSVGNVVVQADFTLTFQCEKLALLVQENAPFIGEVVVLDIGLLPDYLHTISALRKTIELSTAKHIFKKRNNFSHKGTFGHALIVAGSYGKMGAAVLATKACLRTGAGLTTAFIPNCGMYIMQTAVPEAMAISELNSSNDFVISSLPDDVEKYSAIGIGPGIGRHEETQKSIAFIMRRYGKPLVIDADGLNCLAMQPDLLKNLPGNSIITPHPKEFMRLFGEQANDFTQLETACKKAIELNIIIVLKGHHSLVALPDGRTFFNTTGNSGMAKGGSGDVLTGVITALLAQGYSPEEAATLGVFIHGAAADIAVKSIAPESLLASDIIHHLSDAFKEVSF